MIEDSDDNFWGGKNPNGLSMLGKLLAEVRDALKSWTNIVSILNEWIIFKILMSN